MTDKTAAANAIERDGKTYRTISEGQACILVPEGSKLAKDGGEEQQVFYNPIQQYNRDLSTLAVKVYGEWVLEKRAETSKVKLGRQGKKRKRDASDKGDKSAENPADEQSSATSSEPVTHTEHKPTFRILDALSASGLRALRYSLELPFVTSVTANDLSASAAASIKLNVEHNDVAGVCTVTNEDALGLMYRSIAAGLSKRDKRGNPSDLHKFDVIDLDPYGTAAPFFDAALQCVRADDGLLVITCTDSAVWAGHAYCEKSFALYGGVPVKGIHSHEAALRLILNGIATSGARYGLAIEPMLSLSIDFYTKVFVKVNRSPQAVKFLAAKTMLVYSCDQGCGAWETQPILRSHPVSNKKGNGSYYKHTMAQGPSADRFCQHCGVKMHVGGPMYAGPIHSQDFINRLLEEIPKVSSEVYGTLPRLEGMLRTTLEEFIPGPEPPADVNQQDAEAAAVDHSPFFIVPSKLSSVLSCSTPNYEMLRGALLHLGYHAGRSHCRPGSIKTDAPWSSIWWILTEWIKQKAPVKVSKFTPSMPAWKILHAAGIVGQEDGNADGTEEQSAKMEVDSDATPVHVTEEEVDIDVKVNGEQERRGVARDAEGDQAQLTEEELRKTLVFDDALAQLGRQKGMRYMRYQMNPRKNWGPLSKAKAN